MQKVILGIDEVGRGPYAGPLVIGACILPHPYADYPWIDELTDSKKLSEKKRLELYQIIKTAAAASATGWVSSRELDQIGMSAALKLATRRAVSRIRATKVPFTEIIIDGISNFLADTTLESYVTTMKKADLLIKEVSAASIIAKVERDLYMKQLAELYPEYGFEKHVGYGTAHHQATMEKFGLTPEHRRSFTPVKKLDKTTKQIGDAGESKIVDLLEAAGHQIVARNYRTKFFEIDIISEKAGQFFFTEVKTRKNDTHGTPAAMIDRKKLEKMAFAARAYMKLNQNTKDFKLAVGTVNGEGLDWFELDCTDILWYDM